MTLATDWDTDHSIALAPERTAWLIYSSDLGGAPIIMPALSGFMSFCGRVMSTRRRPSRSAETRSSARLPICSIGPTTIYQHTSDRRYG